MKKREVIKLLESGKLIRMTNTSVESKNAIYIKQELVNTPDQETGESIHSRTFSSIAKKLELILMIQNGKELPLDETPSLDGVLVKIYRYKFKNRTVPKVVLTFTDAQEKDPLTLIRAVRKLTIAHNIVVYPWAGLSGDSSHPIIEIHSTLGTPVTQKQVNAVVEEIQKSTGARFIAVDDHNNNNNQ